MVPDLVLHRSVSQVFDIYAVMQTQDLTQYSESAEKAGTPSETSKEQPMLLILQLGLSNHSLLLSQDLKQGLTNEFKEEPSSVPFNTQSTRFSNCKGLCTFFKPRIQRHIHLKKVAIQNAAAQGPH